jgi:Domain of unknown function (DUF4296)
MSNFAPYIFKMSAQQFFNFFWQHGEAPSGYPFQVRPTHKSNPLRAFHYYPLLKYTRRARGDRHVINADTFASPQIFQQRVTPSLLERGPGLPAGQAGGEVPHRPNKIIFTILLSLAFTCIFVSCRTEKPPKDILASEQLTQIMIEFYLAEAKLGNYSLAQDSARKLFMPFEEATLKKYGVADSTLKKTYQYYFDHPTELEKIYEIVIDSLSLRERKATGLPSATPE